MIKKILMLISIIGLTNSVVLANNINTVQLHPNKDVENTIVESKPFDISIDYLVEIDTIYNDYLYFKSDLYTTFDKLNVLKSEIKVINANEPEILQYIVVSQKYIERITSQILKIEKQRIRLEDTLYKGLSIHIPLLLDKYKVTDLKKLQIILSSIYNQIIENKNNYDIENVSIRILKFKIINKFIQEAIEKKTIN